jgi:hypothetical protein
MNVHGDDYDIEADRTHLPKISKGRVNMTNSKISRKDSIPIRSTKKVSMSSKVSVSELENSMMNISKEVLNSGTNGSVGQRNGHPDGSYSNRAVDDIPGVFAKPKRHVRAPSMNEAKNGKKISDPYSTSSSSSDADVENFQPGGGPRKFEMAHPRPRKPRGRFPKEFTTKGAPAMRPGEQMLKKTKRVEEDETKSWKFSK